MSAPIRFTRSQSIASIMDKIEMRGDCWIWTGARTTTGLRYGALQRRGIRGKLAHRVVYETLIGKIPDGLVLDHVIARGCTSTLCVNPRHLEPVTLQENVIRGNSPTAILCRAGVCMAGHAVEGSNAYVWRGRARCRICVAATNRLSGVRRTERNRAVRFLKGVPS